MDDQPQPQHSLRLVLVTGMSGAGRSTAARALEDLGWFIIDNMPPSLLQAAIDLARRTPDVDSVGVVLDARGGSFFRQVSEVVQGLPQEGVDLRTVFLEASDEVLVRRFESSRRNTPSCSSRAPADCSCPSQQGSRWRISPARSGCPS